MSEIVHKLRQAQALLDQGKFSQAKEVLQRVVRHSPTDRQANVLMRHAMARLGQAQQALYYAEQALRSSPEDPELVTLRAMSLADCGRLDEAMGVMEPCVEKNPHHALARATLARMYGVQERLGDCIRTCTPGLNGKDAQGRPVRPDARLLSMYASALLKIGRADEAVPIMKHVAMAAAGAGAGGGGGGGGGPDPVQVSNLANAMLYDPGATPADVYAAHYTYGRVLMNMLPPAEVKFAQTFDPERRLRVGVVSPDFRNHPSHSFLPQTLERLDRERIELFLYSTADREDESTGVYKAIVGRGGSGGAWRACARMSVREMAERIHDDRIDVLIDMAGHTAGGRLLVFQLRPAPVQATWMGYPCTTGLQTMDYRITDSLIDPPGFESQSVEKLVRIDPCFTSYRPPEGLPEVDPTPPSERAAGSPMLGAGGVTFVSFNAIQKVNARVVRTWARVLKESRDARLVIRHRGTLQADVRQHLKERLTQAGASPDMVVVEPPAAGTHEAMAAYNHADIALDTFPYPGVTTTCEALWMGVPVVSMEGRTPHARNGLPMMHAAGLGDLVAKDEDAYVSIAVKLAADAGRRAELRKSLRGALEASALRDEAGFARKFENAVRGMWRERCGGARQ